MNQQLFANKDAAFSFHFSIFELLLNIKTN